MVILILPIGILMAFVGMHTFGLGSNIMSLGDIAIALGAMVDAAIVMIENAHKHVERLKPGEPRGPALIAAAKEVGPSLFSSLLVPVLTLFFIRGHRPGRQEPDQPCHDLGLPPVIHLVLRIPTLTVGAAVIILGVTVWQASQLGSEFLSGVR